jgi:hypothetical protein
VIYSAETGEEYAEYKHHPSEKMQMKFESGIVKIVLVNTP